MLNLPSRFILFDTEYTSWKGAQEGGWSEPGQYRELVQIGAIRVDGDSLEEIDSLTVYVRPRVNPELSEYFVQLTQISQKQIDAYGVDFVEGLNTFFMWSKEDLIYSYGGDEKILQENCVLTGTAFLFNPFRFLDIRTLFEANGIDTSKQTSGNIMHAFGKEPSRRAHDALSDVREVLDGLRFLNARLEPTV